MNFCVKPTVCSDAAQIMFFQSFEKSVVVLNKDIQAVGTRSTQSNADDVRSIACE